MTLEIPRANVDVARRLISAGLTLDQVQAFDQTGHVDGWEGPDIRIVSNGRDIPLGSLEETASVAQAHKLFPLVVAWRFHCIMQKLPVDNATGVSFGENNHHVRHRGRWIGTITTVARGFRSLFGPRRRSPAPPAASTQAQGSDSTTATTTKKRGFFHNLFHRARSWVKDKWKKIKTKVTDTWHKVKTKAVNTWNDAKAAITTKGGLKKFGDILKSGFEDITNTSSTAVKEVTTSVTNDTSKFFTQVYDIQALVKGGKESASQAFSQVVNLATNNAIKNAVNVASSMQKEKDKVNEVSNSEKSMISQATR